MNEEQISSAGIKSIQNGLNEDKGKIEFGLPILLINESDDGYKIERPIVKLVTPTKGWLVGWTDEFNKASKKYDKKLLGRFLEAIQEITKAPITPRGDTVKPLDGNLKGLWRYRIGDYRLIYEPVEAEKRVTLITVDDRGSIY